MLIFLNCFSGKINIFTNCLLLLYTAFQEETVNLLVKLQSDVSCLMRSVSLLIGANTTSPQSGEVPLFPLKSIQEFEKAEEHLQSDQALSNYVSIFKEPYFVHLTFLKLKIMNYVEGHNIFPNWRNKRNEDCEQHMFVRIFSGAGTIYPSDCK